RWQNQSTSWVTGTRLRPSSHEEWQGAYICLATLAMKQAEARRAVLSAYDGWAKKYPNQASMMGGFLFFRYLQAERSDLLDFRAAGNKWQIVHGWIRDSVEKIS